MKIVRFGFGRRLLQLPLLAVLVICLVITSGGGYVVARLGLLSSEPESTEEWYEANSLHLGTGLKGLVGHWKFDGNAKDSSPYGYDGTVSGPLPTNDRYGKSQGAYSFDGDDDYITINDGNHFDTSSVTVAFWIKLAHNNIDCDENNNWRTIIRKGGGATVPTGWSLAMEQSRNLHWRVGTGTTNSSGSFDMQVSSSKYTHIAVTYDAATGDYNMYTNGFLMKSGTFASGGIEGNSEQILIARGTNTGVCPNTSGYLPADLDDLRIYDRALDINEIKRLVAAYDSHIAISTLQKGLIFDMNMNGNAKDATPYSNNGTLMNNPTLTADRKNRANSAYSFDEDSSQYIVMSDSDVFSPSAITASAWVYPQTGTGLNYQILSKGGNSEWRYRINPATESVTVFDRGATNTLSTPNGVITMDAWNHVVFTADDSGIQIYVNGELVESGGEAFGATDTSTNLYIGTYGGSSEFMHGKIDDVRIWNRSLSAPEIKALYDSYR